MKSAFGRPFLAAALAGFLFAPHSALAVDALEMYLDNTSTETLYYVSESRVDEYQITIAPESTGFIKAAAPKDKMQGVITYMNNSVSTEATCTATLSFEYEYDGLSGHCEDKSFTPSTTGACTLVRDGDCYGAGSCKCNFTFSIQ